jgi:hypothetical protein
MHPGVSKGTKDRYYLTPEGRVLRSRAEAETRAWPVGVMTDRKYEIIQKCDVLHSTVQGEHHLKCRGWSPGVLALSDSATPCASKAAADVRALPMFLGASVSASCEPAVTSVHLGWECNAPERGVQCKFQSAAAGCQALRCAVLLIASLLARHLFPCELCGIHPLPPHPPTPTRTHPRTLRVSVSYRMYGLRRVVRLQLPRWRASTCWWTQQQLMQTEIVMHPQQQQRQAASLADLSAQPARRASWGAVLGLVVSS